jgi:hypothetical protein
VRRCASRTSSAPRRRDYVKPARGWRLEEAAEGYAPRWEPCSIVSGFSPRALRERGKKTGRWSAASAPLARFPVLSAESFSGMGSSYSRSLEPSLASPHDLVGTQLTASTSSTIRIFSSAENFRWVLRRILRTAFSAEPFWGTGSSSSRSLEPSITRSLDLVPTQLTANRGITPHSGPGRECSQHGPRSWNLMSEGGVALCTTRSRAPADEWGLVLAAESRSRKIAVPIRCSKGCRRKYGQSPRKPKWVSDNGGEKNGQVLYPHGRRISCRDE